MRYRVLQTYLFLEYAYRLFMRLAWVVFGYILPVAILAWVLWQWHEQEVRLAEKRGEYNMMRRMR